MNLAHLPSHAAIVKSLSAQVRLSLSLSLSRALSLSLSLSLSLKALSAQLHTEVAKWWTPNPPNPK